MDSTENNLSFTFVLFREYQIFGAISHDILRRAIGVSMFRGTTIVLVECTEEFVKHAQEYCNDFNIKFIISSFDELIDYNFYNNIIITHTWSQTMYSVSKIFGIKNLILIEEVVPLSDRFKKPCIDQTLKNRILTLGPILKVITIKYRRYIRKSMKYIAISDDQKNLLIKRYSLIPSFVSYDPIDKRFFKYKEQSTRNSLLVFNNLQYDHQFMNIIDRCRKIGVSKIICIGGEKPSTILNGMTIEHIESYTFTEITEIYSSAMLAITNEAKGSFELIPMESLASGVPIITPEVPSIKILEHYLSNNENQPFFNYFEFLNADLEAIHSWYSSADKSRSDFSKKVLNMFSPETVAKEFLLNLKLN